MQVDPKLLARKGEFEAMQARRPQEMAAFFERCTDAARGQARVHDRRLQPDVRARGRGPRSAA